MSILTQGLRLGNVITKAELTDAGLVARVLMEKDSRGDYVVCEEDGMLYVWDGKEFVVFAPQTELPTTDLKESHV